MVEKKTYWDHIFPILGRKSPKNGQKTHWGQILRIFDLKSEKFGPTGILRGVSLRIFEKKAVNVELGEFDLGNFLFIFLFIFGSLDIFKITFFFF